jgi:hypothetical protein
MMFYCTDERATVIVVEGQQHRAEVFSMTPYQRKCNLCIYAKANLGKHVWYYLLDTTTNTWERSPKYRWFGGRLHQSGKGEKGLTTVPELQLTETKKIL